MYKCVEWGKKKHYAHAGGAKHACPSLDAEGKKEGRKEWCTLDGKSGTSYGHTHRAYDHSDSSHLASASADRV